MVEYSPYNKLNMSGLSPKVSLHTKEFHSTSIKIVLHIDSILRMDNQVLLQKYEEAAKIFGNLPRMFSEEETPLLLVNYDVCISQVEELSSLETDPTFLECLENILTQIKWQQERIRDAYASGTNPDQPLKANPSTNISQEEQKPQKKDALKEGRLATVRAAQRVVSSDGLVDLAGLHHVKALLRRSILLPIAFPKLFTEGRQPWREVLLYGPPGTGKSRLAAALAIETGAELYAISSADLLSSWLGESEKMIKDLFEFTRTKTERTILFIDEVDSLCRKRSASEGDHSRRIKNQLLIELDQSGGHCLVLCATNCPWDLDVAFLRRFHSRIYVPLPDHAARIEIIHKTCGSVKTDINLEDWEVIGKRTEGYSGADLVHLTNFALHEPLGELENNQTWIVKNDKWIPCASNTPQCVKIPISLVPQEKVGVRDVMLKDFLKALDALPKTLDPRQLEKYNQYSTIN